MPKVQGNVIYLISQGRTGRSFTQKAIFWTHKKAKQQQFTKMHSRMIQFQNQKKKRAPWADRNGTTPTIKFMSPQQPSWVSHTTWSLSTKTFLGWSELSKNLYSFTTNSKSVHRILLILSMERVYCLEEKRKKEKGRVNMLLQQQLSKRAENKNQFTQSKH